MQLEIRSTPFGLRERIDRETTPTHLLLHGVFLAIVADNKPTAASFPRSPRLFCFCLARVEIVAVVGGAAVPAAGVGVTIAPAAGS